MFLLGFKDEVRNPAVLAHQVTLRLKPGGNKD